MGHFRKIENLRWQEIKWCLCLECRYIAFKKLLLKCLHTLLALIAFVIYRASQPCLSRSLLSTVSTSLNPFKDSYWRPYPHSSLSVQTLPYLPAFGFSYFVSANICFKRLLLNVATKVWWSLWMNVLFIWEKSDCKISSAIHFSVLMLLLTGMTSSFLIRLVFKSNKQRTVPHQQTSLSSELVSCLSSSAKSDCFLKACSACLFPWFIRGMLAFNWAIIAPAH